MMAGGGIAQLLFLFERKECFLYLLFVKNVNWYLKKKDIT